MSPRAVFSFALVALVGCQFANDPTESALGAPEVSLDVSAMPARWIGEHNLFKDVRRQIPNDGLVPYDLNTPHFADYATLHRFVWVPPETSIRFDEDEALRYPNGSVIVLTVGYRDDLNEAHSDEHIVETRLIVRRNDMWESFQYIWNAEMTDAELSLHGGDVDVAWVDYESAPRSMTYHVPNRNQCKMCHRIEGEFQPLGPVNAAYLNRDYVYSEGSENQLEHWQRIGILEPLSLPPEDFERIPQWDDPASGTLDQRARAYLDMNCSSCHRPGGLGFTSGLDLRYAQNDPVKFGVYKAPVAAGRGVGSARFGIVPGEPENSILIHRLRSTDPGIRMPAVGRGLVHADGLALIESWIREMDYPDLAENQRAADQAKVARQSWSAPETFVQVSEGSTL